MLGKKILKTDTEQVEIAQQWCANNGAMLVDNGVFYEVLRDMSKPQTVKNEPTVIDEIQAQVMYTALMTDTLIESEVE